MHYSMMPLFFKFTKNIIFISNLIILFITGNFNENSKYTIAF